MSLGLVIVEATLLAALVGGIAVSRSAWFARRSSRQGDQGVRPWVFTTSLTLTLAAVALGLLGQLLR